MAAVGGHFFNYFSACAIRTIALAISSGDRIKSIQPLAIALSVGVHKEVLCG